MKDGVGPYEDLTSHVDAHEKSDVEPGVILPKLTEAP